MTIQTFIHDLMADYKSTFKETSLDDRGGQTKNYLCQDNTTEVYNFDKYVLENIGHPLPASPDAIYVGNNKLYFVEFKNQPISNIDENNIKRKFESGTQILKDLLTDHLPSEIEFIFCIVYQPTHHKYFNPMPIISNIIRFGLESENSNNNNFYSKIITQDVDFYKMSFDQLKCI